MNVFKSPDKIAGLLSFFSALLVLISWYILLFVATPDGITPMQSATDQLKYTFLPNNPSHLWFIWFAVLPFASIIIGLCYFGNSASSKTGAITLLVLSSSLGIATVMLNDWPLALFALLPSIWGIRCVQKAQ